MWSSLDKSNRGKFGEEKECHSSVALYYTALVAYGLFKYFPILQAAVLSLRSSSALGTGNFVGFANYLRAFSDELFRRAWFNTFYFVVLNLLINFIPPIVLAICISEVRKGQSFFRTAFFIPSLTPAIVTMVLWKWIYNPDYGLLITFWACSNCRSSCG